MRRIQFACLEQTLRFSLHDVLPAGETEKLVRAEVEQYKTDLQRKGVRYSIVSESVQPDGSMILKIKRQYNAHNPGSYLD